MRNIKNSEIRKMTGILPRLLMFVVLAGAVSGAHAVAITDVTYEGDFADEAVLLHGNDSVGAINSLGGGFAGDAWVLIDKTGESSTEIEGVTFTVTADNTGAFNLSWNATGTPGLPLWMDFVFVDKAANDFGAYLFKSELFTSDPLTGSGTFNISWLNNGGQTPNLSHVSVYGRAVSEPVTFDVPEPGTLALFSMGILGLAFSRRKV